MSWASRNKGAILPAAGLLLGGPTGMAAGAALAGGLDANANRRKSEAALQPLVNDLQNTYSNPATPALTAQRNNMLANAARLYRNTVGANSAALAGRGMTDSSVAQGAQYRADKALAEGLATTNEAYLQTLEQRRQNAMDRLMSILNGNEAQARADEGEALGTLGTLANEWARRDRLKKIKNSSTINPNVSRAANAYAAQFGQRAELDAPTRTEYRADPMLPAETIAGQPDVVTPSPVPGTLATATRASMAPSETSARVSSGSSEPQRYLQVALENGNTELIPLTPALQEALQPMSIRGQRTGPVSLVQTMNGNLGIAANLLLGRGAGGAGEPVVPTIPAMAPSSDAQPAIYQTSPVSDQEEYVSTEPPTYAKRLLIDIGNSPVGPGYETSEGIAVPMEAPRYPAVSRRNLYGEYDSSTAGRGDIVAVYPSGDPVKDEAIRRALEFHGLLPVGGRL